METSRTAAWSDADLICAEDGLSRTLNNRGLYERVLLLFLDAGDFARLEEAVAAGDRAAGQGCIHSLKGTAANLGLCPLAGLAEKIQRIYQDGGDPGEDLKTFFELYGRTTNAIKAFLAK